jgi:hypothetical protein
MHIVRQRQCKYHILFLESESNILRLIARKFIFFPTPLYGETENILSLASSMVVQLTFNKQIWVYRDSLLFIVKNKVILYLSFDG